VAQILKVSLLVTLIKDYFNLWSHHARCSGREGENKNVIDYAEKSHIILCKFRVWKLQIIQGKRKHDITKFFK
jgi:hypothetical protein